MFLHSSYNPTSIILIINLHEYSIDADELLKVGWIYKIAGLNSTDYWVWQDSDMEFTDAGKQTMIARLLENRDTGFTLIYEDELIKAYEAD